MFYRVRRCLAPNSAYRLSRLADKFQLVISRKEVELDYLAVDVSGLVGTGLRMSKNVTREDRKIKEVARHVAQNLSLLLKRFHIKKGLALMFDGAESLAKANLNRSATMTRRLESRLQRLPGTSLMQTVEDRIVKSLPEGRYYPREIVLSGTCVAGSVEQKFSAWVLDVASRDSWSPNDSVGLLGSSELYLNCIAMTPAFNISNLVLNNNDLKQIRLQDALDWLAIGTDPAAGATTEKIARQRTDALFLYMLCFGCSATDMSALASGPSFADLLDAYYDEQKLRSAYLFEHSSSSSSLTEPGAASSSSQPLMTLNVAMFDAVLTKGTKKHSPAKQCVVSHGYLQSALQSLHLLCLGFTADPMFVPPMASAPPLMQQLCSHVKYLLSLQQSTTAVTLSPSLSSAPVLTAAAFTAMSYSIGATLDSYIQHVVGSSLKSDVAKSICNTTDPVAALKTIHEVFSFANPSKPPKTLCYSPSYCWLQNEKSKLWSMSYIDMGARHVVDQTRVQKGEKGKTVSFSANTDGPVWFDAPTGKWTSVPKFPLEPTIPNNNNNNNNNSGTRQLRLLTWNVMFDRYSGKPTPLGMPGIDWCSPKRYPVLSAVMQREDADIIGMQEVEPQFWEYLGKQDWVRQNYLFSCPMDGPPISPWGVLMMVHRRLAVNQLTHVNVPAWSNHTSLMPIVTIDTMKGPLNIAAVHLLAPYNKTHENARTAQDSVLRQRMQKLVGESITMGDFNDWPTSEFVMPPESQYVEAWPLLNPGNPGKTMDETNTFCKLKIEEIFFGRSDKIFFRCQKWKPVSAKMVGVKSVNEENGNTNAPAYLFPSDHYGVQISFEC